MAMEIKELLKTKKTVEVVKVTGHSRNIVNKIKHGHRWKCLSINTREDQ